MKKLVCICALVMLCVFSGAAKDNHKAFNRLCRVAKEVDKIEGVETVKISGLLMSLMKAAAKSETKKEAKESSEKDDDLEMGEEFLKNLSAILMVDYEDAAPEYKAEITRKFVEVLSAFDLIMEANDEEDRARMYGRVDSENGIVEDMVFLDESGGALMAFCGKLSLSEAMSVAD